MRDYAKITAGTWTGATGQEVRRSRDPALLWALIPYLIGCRHATMLGLFPLPLAYASHDLGIEPERVRAGLLELQALGFLVWDEATEVVWIVEAVRHQVLGADGAPLGERDNQVKAVRKHYAAAPPCAQLAPFYDRWGEHLRLDVRRTGPHQVDLIEGPDPRLEATPSEGGGQPPPKPGAGAGTGEGPGPVRDREAAADVLDQRGADPAAVTYRPRKRGQRVVVLEWERREDWVAFWDAFGYKAGKQDALSAWVSLSPTREQVRTMIVPCARAEAHRRQDLERSGRTPIMAQGWLNARRFEDEALQELARKIGAMPKSAEELEAEERRREHDAEREHVTNAHHTVGQVRFHLRDEGAAIKRREGETAPAWSKRTSEVLGLVLDGRTDEARTLGLTTTEEPNR